MINFTKYTKLDNCILLENSAASKQMETHLTHIEDLAIEKGKQGFIEFGTIVNLFLTKIQGLESELDINLKIDGAPALLFGRDSRQEFKDQFFIALKYAVDSDKGIIKEGAKLLHSEQEIMELYGSRPSFAEKLKILFNELNRAYDNSGNIYQCDVLYAGKSDKWVERYNGEDYVAFKPNVIVYAVPVDISSDTYNLVNDSEVGVVVHDSFKGIATDNFIRLQHNSRSANSIIQSGKIANVFILGSNFTQPKVELDSKDKQKISDLLSQCKEYIPLISDMFDAEYKVSPVMELLKIYINKQVDLPDSGIFGKRFNKDNISKFLKNFQRFIEKRFEIIINKKATEKGRTGQRDKMLGLFSFLESHTESLLAIVTLFTIMIEIKKILLNIVEQLGATLKGTFFQGAEGVLVPTKGEGHVLFSGNTHVKIVDRLEFTKINRSRGGQHTA